MKYISDAHGCTLCSHFFNIQVSRYIEYLDTCLGTHPTGLRALSGTSLTQLGIE